jgi:serine/threonine-protein kinase
MRRLNRAARSPRSRAPQAFQGCDGQYPYGGIIMSEPGFQVGPYRVVEVLGEGGMGVVYLAEQSEPVRRQVALKLLKSGADSAQVLARFDQERQALAVMDHPSIAKVFDAGVTDDGRPYFAMEFVTGAPLTRYCDDRRLSIRKRVGLFVDLCHAVQHAHQKGVIHRDLKPQNVLVSDVDGRSLPRIIDFGIAKATQANVFDGTQLTRDDQVVGTPAYMSPEQIDGSGDMDTRTDIYALGVLLYEILSGALPYDRKAYRGWAAVATQVHRDPPSLARRFADLADTQETVSANRGTTPPVLRRELAGDLGWIVSRAMEKDKEQRYETANAMALDLARFLNHEPVRARGATTAYLMRKFVRRNRLGVAFGATVALGVIGFSIVTKVQADRIAQARDEADARRGQAEGLVDFMLGDLREKLEPIGRLEILDDVGEQATQYFSAIPEEQFSDEELASRSRSLYQIGKVRLDQGDSKSAVAGFVESLRLAKALSDRAPDDPDRLFGLSQSHFYVGYASWLAGDLEAAEREFLGYMTAAERLVDMQPENLDYRLELGFAHGNLGMVREGGGDLSGAAQAYALSLVAKGSLVERDSLNGGWIRELAETHNKLGVINRKLGDYKGAQEQHTLELELKTRLRGLDPQHADWKYRFSWALAYSADVRRDLGALDESLEFRDRQIAVLDSLVELDPTNARWRRARGLAWRDRGAVLVRLGRSGDARVSLDRSMAELTGPDAADLGSEQGAGDLAYVNVARAELALAVDDPIAALEATEAVLSSFSANPVSNSSGAGILGEAQRLRGRAFLALGRADEAGAAWERALDVIEPFSRGEARSQFRPLRAELLMMLGRTVEARHELEVLRASGYVDSALDELHPALSEPS